MEGIQKINYYLDLITELKLSSKDFPVSIGNSYQLLQLFSDEFVIPQITRTKMTLAIVETTTCGLIGDLLTIRSGASEYFIMSIIPYHNRIKEKIGVSKDFLSSVGPGTVSKETARELSNKIIEFSGAKLGIAETGLLSSTELERRKTKKRAGEVYVSITLNGYSKEEYLRIQPDLPRNYMRHEIAFRILQKVQEFLVKI
ncbi:CinA family protein [Candidatus Hodarchaeum mangrovi]